MQKAIIFTCIMAMLCMTQQGVADDAQRSADHDALRALRDKVEKSINDGDMKELRSCLAEDFTFITSDQTVITNLADIVAYWDGMFKNEKSPVTAMKAKFTADILTRFTGPDVGYCHGTSKDVYTLKNKRKVALTNTWSVMLVKEADAWKVNAAHIGVNFLDNPVSKAGEMSWFGKLCVALRIRKLPGEVKE